MLCFRYSQFACRKSLIEVVNILAVDAVSFCYVTIWHIIQRCQFIGFHTRFEGGSTSMYSTGLKLNYDTQISVADLEKNRGGPKRTSIGLMIFNLAQKRKALILI